MCKFVLKHTFVSYLLDIITIVYYEQTLVKIQIDQRQKPQKWTDKVQI